MLTNQFWSWKYEDTRNMAKADKCQSWKGEIWRRAIFWIGKSVKGQFWKDKSEKGNSETENINQDSSETGQFWTGKVRQMTILKRNNLEKCNSVNGHPKQDNSEPENLKKDNCENK